LRYPDGEHIGEQEQLLGLAGSRKGLIGFHIALRYV
jgi:hypothetical protein